MRDSLWLSGSEEEKTPPPKYWPPLHLPFHLVSEDTGKNNKAATRRKSNGCISAVKRQSESCSVVSDSLQTHGLYSPWNFLGQNTGVGSLSLFQGIFPIQGQSPAPGGSAGKESACTVRDLGSIPGLGRSPGEGNGYTPVFWPGEIHGLYRLYRLSQRVKRQDPHCKLCCSFEMNTEPSHFWEQGWAHVGSILSQISTTHPEVLVTQSCPTLDNSMDSSPPGSSV